MSWDFRLVIPAFRELHRLPPFLNDLQAVLSQAPFTTEILVVDDGSPEIELAVLLANIRVGRVGNCQISTPLGLSENQGKGAAILHGWRALGGQARFLAFVDADGAIPAQEIRRVFGMAFSAPNGEAAYFPDRSQAPGFVRRPFVRWIAGFVFRNLVRGLIDSTIRDSQCGFKVLPASTFRRVDPLLNTTGFCFDADLLAALRQVHAPILQLPIFWQDKKGGHVNVLVHAPLMIRELLRIRRRYRVRALCGPAPAVDLRLRRRPAEATVAANF